MDNIDHFTLFVYPFVTTIFDISNLSHETLSHFKTE